MCSSLGLEGGEGIECRTEDPGIQESRGSLLPQRKKRSQVTPMGDIDPLGRKSPSFKETIIIYLPKNCKHFINGSFYMQA